MRMRGKSRSQLIVRYTCKAYSGIDLQREGPIGFIWLT
jgi:hypothetical protein